MPELRGTSPVCRMCRFFDRAAPKQCREDDAEEVTEKERVNFCEWFKPSVDAFDPVRAKKDAKAKYGAGRIVRRYR